MSNLIKDSLAQRSPLTASDREIIELRLRCRCTIRQIAAHLGRSHTIISREIKRNKCPGGRYRAKYAHAQAEKKSHKTNKKKLDKNFMLKLFVRDGLKNGWSPEQIAGRLKKESPDYLKKARISYESIYQYIYTTIEGKHWYHFLRKKRTPKRQKRFNRKNRIKIEIRGRVSIHERPAMINNRKRFGDWESDSAQFRKQKSGLSVQYERRLMLVRMHRIQDRSREETEAAIRKSIDSLDYHDLWKSVTFDNGGEGAGHENIKRDYGIMTYFCDPYKSWQKGGVENTIGLIREYLPKNANLDTITDEDIYQFQERINNRPRKKLSYLTPNEALKQYLNPYRGA